MKVWWEGLGQRERQLVALAVALVVLIAGYAMVWQPMHDALAVTRQRVANKQQILLWMENARAEAQQQQRATAQSAPDDDGQSLSALLESSAKSSGISEALSRIQPSGNDSARLAFSDVEFNNLMRWLARLQQVNRTEIKTASLDANQDQPGLVNGQVELER